MLADTSETLEWLVDRDGLAGVLEALQGVCRDKADHLRSAWQDMGGAALWERAARRIGRAGEGVPS